MSLEGAQVVVVGGSSGIGLATARAVRAAGAHVTIAGRSAEKLAQAQREVSDVRTAVADITAEQSVAELFGGLDRVDHVLISAGTIRNGRIVDNDLETLRAIIDERLLGVAHVIRHARPLMTQGSITFTSGGLSSRPRPGTAMLTAALAAVEAMTPALVLELDPIRVNTVTPGLIDTPLLEEAYGAERDALIKNRSATLPGKRIGTADEVAQTIVMCMTNAYLNGAVIPIDGGGRFL